MWRNRGRRSPTSQTERPGADPSLTTLEGTNPADTRISTSSLQAVTRNFRWKTMFPGVSSREPKNKSNSNYLGMRLWKSPSFVLLPSKPQMWAREQGMRLRKLKYNKVHCSYRDSVTFLEEISPGCCKPLANFQNYENFDSDNFCQIFSCFHGGPNFQMSLMQHPIQENLAKYFL